MISRAIPGGIAALDRLIGKSLVETGVDESRSVFETVLVTVGPETFSPVKYNSFSVGPISATARVEPGETLSSAYSRAYHNAHALFDAEYQIAVQRYFDRIRENAERLAADVARRGRS